MAHFIDYKDGTLHIENVSLQELTEQYPTPFYAYSKSSIENAYDNCVKAYHDKGIDIHVHYAVKTNTNVEVVKTLIKKGAGADVTSGGELLRALEAGCDPEKIIFSGVGKTHEELGLALDKQIGQINVESINELQLLNQIASDKGAKPTITLRVNPDVDSKAHAKTATGGKQTKFGINKEDAPHAYKMATDMDNINICGLAAHIGSQVLAIETFHEQYKVLNQMAADLRQNGYLVERMDIGGGLGVDYSNFQNQPQFDEWASYAADVFKDGDYHLSIEPGRSLVGQAGVLVTRVIYIKESGEKTFLIVDAAMNDLMRPTLYDAFHEIVPVAKPESESSKLYDVVGPVCETGDAFAIDRKLSGELKEGDLLIIGSAGAYGHVMASTYNMRPIPAEILVDSASARIIRERQKAF